MCDRQRLTAIVEPCAGDESEEPPRQVVDHDPRVEGIERAGEVLNGDLLLDPGLVVLGVELEGGLPPASIRSSTSRFPAAHRVRTVSKAFSTGTLRSSEEWNTRVGASELTPRNRVTITSGKPRAIQLGRTIARWATQILNWHHSAVTNGPTEGLNNLIKRIKRAAFGFRNFAHYRIRALLNAGRPNWKLLTTITPRQFPMTP